MSRSSSTARRTATRPAGPPPDLSLPQTIRSSGRERRFPGARGPDWRNRQGRGNRLEFELSPLPQPQAYVSPTELREPRSGSTANREASSAPARSPPRGTGQAHDPSRKRELQDHRAGTGVRAAGTTVDWMELWKARWEHCRSRSTHPNTDVRLTLQREGESYRAVHSRKTLQLPPGTYTVQAVAPGFHDFSATVASRSIRSKQPISCSARSRKKG